MYLIKSCYEKKIVIQKLKQFKKYQSIQNVWKKIRTLTGHLNVRTFDRVSEIRGALPYIYDKLWIWVRLVCQYICYKGSLSSWKIHLYHFKAYKYTALCNHNCWIVYVVYASGDEDNILDQISVKQICSDFYENDFKFS